MSDKRNNNEDERESLVNKAASLRAIYNESEDKILLGRKISRVLRKLIPGYSANGEIDEAWSYFEHITLPRQQLASDGSGKKEKAPPGANRTWLYPGWTTPQDDLRDFGTGVAIYFETMRGLIVICLIAGCIYFPNFLYYRSEEYAAEGQSHLVGTLRGSLICPDTKWVPCPTCTEEDWADDLGRFARTLPNNLDDSNETFTFVLSNECADFRLREGILHLVVMAFLTVAIFSLGFFQTRRELEYDEELLTASDFSIKVDNPPPDAVDPDEWKEFFSQIDGGEVVYCTVALDNEDLIKALAKRRVLLLKLRHKLKASELKDMAFISVSSEVAQAHPKEYKQLLVLEETCRELLSNEYATTSIFVTFQTEKAQRNVLRNLSVSKIDLSDNNIAALRHPHCAFRSSLVLDVAEAREPTSIRWEDQDETSMHKFIQRVFTSFLTALLMGLGFIAVRSAFRKDVNLAAYVIALLNIAGSHVFKFVNRLEAHPNEGGYQASLYVKLSIFRWMNTAVVTTLVTPFTKTISEGGLIESVHAVLKAEIITLPIVHMCDIMGTIRRHFLAPFAPHQDSMNMYFRGGVQSLGEKYTVR
uniref:CSC1/OSCA1-like cytosolic domain-containing protein n=1 Tax=Attheya septentrionalis TaxID=420275 RepID=A0A7S2UQW1_9STRA|mmetsp:Transcript_621/g.1124  ORF Transcript_621/g.1124 Transcript_621/m.1124 type:complete len:588 (+) Transcript_621:226-1989(+)